MTEQPPSPFPSLSETLIDCLNLLPSHISDPMLLSADTLGRIRLRLLSCLVHHCPEFPLESNPWVDQLVAQSRDTARAIHSASATLYEILSETRSTTPADAQSLDRDRDRDQIRDRQPSPERRRSRLSSFLRRSRLQTWARSRVKT